MSRLKRRHFLQLAAVTCASIGISQSQLGRQATRYGKVLAQSTPRKLALLIGINDYQTNRSINDLYGCVNDVELQRQLLIHRFGFNPKNIVTLTDAAASRQGILETFEQHLIDQAKAGDVVVFHYSGHGSRVDDPTPIDPENPRNSTFIPADEDSPDGNNVKDIMGQTLFLLMSLLGRKTENVTAVLDSCFSGGGTRGQAIVRAGKPGRNVAKSEFAYQQSLLDRLGWEPDDFLAARREGVAVGAVLASTQPNQLAVDYPFEDFYAGGFTYLLTQYLWQQTTDVSEAIAVVQNRIDDISNQDPLYEVKVASNAQTAPIYFTQTTQAPADAIVTAVLPGNKAKLWLGGLDWQSIEAFGPESELVPLKDNETRLILEQRVGLEAIATIQGQVAVGDLLQEYARAIPSDLQLVIGLDDSLGSDRAPAAQTLNQNERTVAVESQGGNYPQTVHYILGRVTTENQDLIIVPDNGRIPSIGSTGLFSPSLELLPKSFGLPGEAIAATLQRLQPKFKGLLATRVISQTLNAQSSELDVRVSLKLEESNTSILGEAFTFRGNEANAESNYQLARIPINKAFQLKIANNHDKDLYLGVMAIDVAGEITILFPNEHQDVSDEELAATTRIAAQGQLLVPDPEEDDFVLASDELGSGEILVIASEKPMTEALKRLRNLARSVSKARGPIQASDPVALMSDFAVGASRGVGAHSIAWIRMPWRRSRSPLRSFDINTNIPPSLNP